MEVIMREVNHGRVGVALRGVPDRGHFESRKEDHLAAR
jgi:hypothetical protein